MAHSESLSCNTCVDNGYNFCTKKGELAEICCKDGNCAQAGDSQWSCSSSFKDLAEAKNAVCPNKLAQAKVTHSEGLSCNVCVDNGYNFCTKDFAQICCLDGNCAQAGDSTWSCSASFTDLAQAKQAICPNKLAQTKVAHSEALGCNTCVDNGYNFCVKDQKDFSGANELSQICCLSKDCAQTSDKSWSCTSNFESLAQAKNAVCPNKLAQAALKAKVAHSETLGCNVCIDNGYNFCTRTQGDFAQVCCLDATCSQAKDSNFSCSASFSDLAQAKNSVCINKFAQIKNRKLF